MPFGKHKGKTLGIIPAAYLLYLKDKEIAKGALLKYIIDSDAQLHMRARHEQQIQNKFTGAKKKGGINTGLFRR